MYEIRPKSGEQAVFHLNPLDDQLNPGMDFLIWKVPVMDICVVTSETGQQTIVPLVEKQNFHETFKMAANSYLGFNPEIPDDAIDMDVSDSE